MPFTFASDIACRKHLANQRLVECRTMKIIGWMTINMRAAMLDPEAGLRQSVKSVRRSSLSAR